MCKKLPFSDTIKENEDISIRFRELIKELLRMGITFEEAKEELEKIYIEEVLQKFNGNLSRAAKFLEIHRNTLTSRIEKYKLNRGKQDSEN